MKTYPADQALDVHQAPGSLAVERREHVRILVLFEVELDHPGIDSPDSSCCPELEFDAPAEDHWKRSGHFRRYR
jgi:hypothetical protein